MTTEIEAQFVAAGADEGSLPPRYEGEIPAEGPLDPEPGVEAFLRALEAGEPWYRRSSASSPAGPPPPSASTA